MDALQLILLLSASKLTFMFMLTKLKGNNEASMEIYWTISFLFEEIQSFSWELLSFSVMGAREHMWEQ